MQKTAQFDRDVAAARCSMMAWRQVAAGRRHTFRALTKTLLIMKLTVVCLLMGLLTAHAESFSQTITFSGKNVAFTKVFDVIEKQTGYNLFANKGLLKVTKPV